MSASQGPDDYKRSQNSLHSAWPGSRGPLHPKGTPSLRHKRSLNVCVATCWTILYCFYSLRGRRKKGRGRGRGEGEREKGREPPPLANPPPLFTFLPIPYPLPLSTPATQAIVFIPILLARVWPQKLDHSLVFQTLP